jgi:hypothetical protein
MPYAHTNRHGVTLYLHAGSACGEPFVFRESIGKGALDAVPDGFEVYEDPNGRVRLVLEADDLVTDAHVQVVRSALESTPYADYGVEVVDEVIVIMQPDWTRAELARFLDRPVTSLTAEEIRDNTHYAPILRLEPSLAVNGHYSLMRMEFDPIPGWSEPLLEGPLEEVAARLESRLRDASSSDF